MFCIAHSSFLPVGTICLLADAYQEVRYVSMIRIALHAHKPVTKTSESITNGLHYARQGVSIFENTENGEELIRPQVRGVPRCKRSAMNFMPRRHCARTCPSIISQSSKSSFQGRQSCTRH